MEQNLPSWMHDPSLSTIPEEKLLFLLDFKEKTSGLDKKQMMPIVMQLIKDAREKNLTFSKNEINLIVNAIKATSTREEQNRIDQIIKKASEAK